jgi:hypothetical protein
MPELNIPEQITPTALENYEERLTAADNCYPLLGLTYAIIAENIRS